MKNSPKDKGRQNAENSVNSKTQGVGRLTIDAVLAITDIVESMHQRISASV